MLDQAGKEKGLNLGAAIDAAHRFPGRAVNGLT